jgi:hypothetical protein
MTIGELKKALGVIEPFKRQRQSGADSALVQMVIADPAVTLAEILEVDVARLSAMSGADVNALGAQFIRMPLRVFGDAEPRPDMWTGLFIRFPKVS